MKTRERWLHEGLKVLAESGIGGVTIEALSTRLNLSKGSFYHHFDGMPGYRQALLQYFEERESQQFIERANAAPDPAGEPRLRRMVADVMAAEGGRPQLENAVRSWASGDPVAQDLLERVDRARFDFFQIQFEAMGLEPEAAVDYASIAHLATVGAAHARPPLAPPEVIRLWDRLLVAAAECARPRAVGRSGH